MQEQKETTMKQTPASSWLKDFATPIAIVVAGAFVGAGMYFNSSETTPSAAGTAPEAKTILQLAVEAGADAEAFTQCFENGETLAAVQEDLDDAVETGGRGTPWGILIGPTGKQYQINGAIPQQAVEQLIAIAQKDEAAPAGTNADTLALMNEITADDHYIGNLDAPIKIVEYSDFECPFCKRFHQTMHNIAESYGPDELVWVYRHFPLESIHPQAKALAVASECVAKSAGNNGFWAFTDAYLAQ